MARIPPDLEPAIREKAGQGMSGIEIAAWLKTEHGVEVTPRAVQKRLAADREERAEFSRGIVQRELQKGLTRDLAILSRIQDELAADAGTLRNCAFRQRPGDTRPASEFTVDDRVYGLYLDTVDRLQRVTALKMRHCGLEEAPAPPPGADPRRALLDRLDQFIAAEAEKHAVH